jgi:hypothetical protein
MTKRLEIEEEIEYLVIYSSKTIGDFSCSYYNKYTIQDQISD